MTTPLQAKPGAPLRRRTMGLLAGLGAVALVAAGPLAAAPGDPPAAPGDQRPSVGDQRVAPIAPARLTDDKARVRTATIPARGLFVGDQLSDFARARLTDLIIDALGLDVQVALIVPTGPWQVDGGTHADNDLTTARLQAVRRFLSDRGIDAKRIFVESRIDPRLREPQLQVQLLGQPGSN